MSLRNLVIALKGGAGSGNFGHSGRPGKIGGSSGGRGAVSAELVSTTLERVSDTLNGLYKKVPARSSVILDRVIQSVDRAHDEPKRLRTAKRYLKTLSNEVVDADAKQELSRLSETIDELLEG